jgi:hypothetical protein
MYYEAEKKVQSTWCIDKEESSDKNVKSKEATDGDIRSPGLDTNDFAAVKSVEDFKVIVDDGDYLCRTNFDLCYT